VIEREGGSPPSTTSIPLMESIRGIFICVLKIVKNPRIF
jgi:hypothetical protein